ncbi:MAG: sterol desaturase family protein, partial [Myxococcota bacterium]
MRLVRDGFRFAESRFSALVRSRANYWSTFGIDACATIALLAWGILHYLEPGPYAWSALAALLVGWSVWTLFEYLVHRFVFHGAFSPASRAHLEHHRAPRDLVGLPFFVPIGVAVAWWLVLTRFLPSGPACLVVAGSYAGYVGYGAVHHATHATPLRAWPLERRQRMHMIHHARAARNFGVTTGFWEIGRAH